MCVVCIIWESQRVENSYNFWMHGRMFVSTQPHTYTYIHIHDREKKSVHEKSFRVHVVGYSYKQNWINFISPFELHIYIKAMNASGISFFWYVGIVSLLELFFYQSTIIEYCRNTLCWLFHCRSQFF